jgi:acyl carrier protein
MNQSQPTAAARHRGFRPIEPANGLRLFLAASAASHHYLLVGLDLANPAIINELIAERLHISELLVAYIGEQVEAQQVQAAIAPSSGLCPVPIRVVKVSRIRTGADGGVDGAQLLLDDVDRMGGVRAEPATELEREIARIWSDVLDRPVVSRDDSFFDLGGNSLRATRILALVDRKLAVRITTQQLYTTPTVAGMAAAVAQARGRHPG